MPKFDYIVVDKAGKSKKGIIEAADIEAARLELRERGLYPQNVKIHAEAKLSKEINFSKKIPIQVVSVFCIQFSAILKAGISPLRAIGIIKDQQEDERMKAVLNDVYVQIQHGVSLSEAFSAYSDRFPEVFVNMIEAGEATGSLDTNMERLGITLEKSHKLNAQIKSALMYPCIVLVLCVVILIVMMAFVIPKFADMFNASGSDLPGTTKFMLGMSDFIINRWPILLLAVAVIVFAIVTFKRSDYGKNAIGKFKLKCPKVGPLYSKIIAAKFTRSLNSLVSSGVPVPAAMEISSRSVANTFVEKKLLYATNQVKQGVEISAALKEQDVFPQMVYEMIGLGEETGALESLLTKTADYFDQESEEALKRLTGLIEPATLVLMGGMIGFIVISIMQPIFNISSTVV
ncbi:MAG: type II secretion system F family protein [Clostridia bacterium]|nr:type II secretion system F family protein [Clostridia bacterium]